MEKKLVHFGVVEAGSRTFKFRVKVADNGKQYLVVTEQENEAPEGEGYKSMVLFESDIERFAQAFLQSLLHFQVPDRDEMIAKAREKFPNAFKPWSEADEEELEKQYVAGSNLEELAKAFGRNTPAIRARLRKMGLMGEKPQTAGA